MSSAVAPEDLTELAVAEGNVSPSTSVNGGADQREPHVDNPLKVVIASSVVLRLAGALTASLLGSYLKQDLGAGAALIGILSALFYVTELTLSPVFGALSDLRGRRFILVLGPLLGVIALPIYPISAIVSVSWLAVSILVVARLIEGVSTAAKVPSALGYLADATAGEGPKWAAMRGRVMGAYEISFLIGFVGGYILGGVLWKEMAVSGFYLVSLVYLVATLMLYFFVPETLPAQAKAHHTQAKQSVSDAQHPVRALLRSRLKAYAALIKEPALRGFIPAWLAINAVVGLWGVHVQPILLKPKDGAVSQFPDQLLDGKFESTGAGIAFGGFGLLFMIGIFLWSLVYARVRRTNVMLLSVVGLALVCVAMYGINNSVVDPWFLVPVLGLGIFLTSGFTPVALAYLAEISGARVEHRGAVMGLYSVFLGVGQLVGSGAGGLFISGMGIGFNGLILATAILGAVAGIAVVWLRMQHKV